MTASALLDLLTAEEVDALADACTAAGCPALLTLSVTARSGSSRRSRSTPCSPPPSTPTSGGPWTAAACSGRTRAPPQSRPSPGAASVTEVRSSPWRLGPDDAALIEEWLRGWIAAGCAQQPDLAARAADYLRRRLDACAAGDCGSSSATSTCSPYPRGGRVSGRAVAAGQDGRRASASSSRSSCALGAQAFVDGLAAIGVGSVLAALGLGLLTTVASAARWCIVARGLGLRLPLAAAVADCYRAVFLNSVLPAGVLGDVHRAVGYGRQHRRRRPRGPGRRRSSASPASCDRRRRAGRAARRPADRCWRAVVPGRLRGPPSCSPSSSRSALAVLWTARDPPRRPRSAPRCGRPAPTPASGCSSRSTWPGAAGAVGGHAGRLPRAVRRRRPGRGVARRARRAAAAARPGLARDGAAAQHRRVGSARRGDGRGVRRGRPRRGRRGSRPPSCTGC